MRCLLPALLLVAGPAVAVPVHYTIDPGHTYPSFSADHMGISTFRGKFDHTTVSVMLDRAKQTGHVRIVTRIDSINFGNPALTRMVLRDTLPAALCQTQCAFFAAARYPDAVSTGTLADFRDGAPTRVVGKLTPRGVTRPLDLAIEHFKCIPDPQHTPRERCGAEVSATFNRADFGIDAGQSFGFDMTTRMQIQVEAVQDD